MRLKVSGVVFIRSQVFFAILADLTLGKIQENLKQFPTIIIIIHQLCLNQLSIANIDRDRSAANGIDWVIIIIFCKSSILLR